MNSSGLSGQGGGVAGGVAVASSGEVVIQAAMEEVTDEAVVYEPFVEEPALASSHQSSQFVAPTTKNTPSIWPLLNEFNSLSRDEEASALPCCIAHNVSLEQFHAVCDLYESFQIELNKTSSCVQQCLEKRLRRDGFWGSGLALHK
jgi:hypothetical protein